MNKTDILDKLQEIFRDIFGNPSLIINEKTNQNDIDGWDSLTHITILEAVQDEFALSFSLEEMIELNDVRKIVDIIIRDGDDSGLERYGSKQWNASYTRGGNILFYPHEEIIRFVNKYVRKRHDINVFEDILPLLSSEKNFSSLDLGCGIGRHVKYLDESGLNPYGIDLSETAISKGKEWLISIGKKELADKLTIGSVTNLPYEDNTFGICVSHGVLDSMPREIAVKGMQEVKRVLLPGALMYLDLIMGTELIEGDTIVDDGYEQGTIQSYFTVDSIKEFLSEFDIIDFNIITSTDDTGTLRNKRAHLIIKNLK
ncbi:methyltransferase domain-containing protein [Butyrivibrio fibrisolvens]|uniref:Methyltransferase type 11 n=1 Tax=Butyrivibrio fibrisolvens TaxID=831 RepID=A0A317FWK3_BUTFI|nr:methyltransferase domain-containing protein [Butyrivibrio fibrisolvens]PWT26055.1 methyltransferase type 11 [Butyrivibrio fibrisolvens]